MFRLDRVEEVSPDEHAEPFTRPSDFDGLDFVLRSLAAAPRAYSVVVTLFAGTEEVRHVLPASLGATSLEEREEGVVLRCTTDSLQWTAHLLARLECDFAVHEPPELRDALRRLAAQLTRAAEAPPAAQSVRTAAPQRDATQPDAAGSLMGP